MIEFRERRGGISSSDLVLELKASNWHALSYKELLYILNHVFENEDRLYPTGKGRWMIVDAINDLAVCGNIKQITERYML